MVLGNDVVYHAISTVEENGYWVIDEKFGTILVAIGIAFWFVLGFLAGLKEAKRRHKDKEE